MAVESRTQGTEDFESILFANPADRLNTNATMPEFFVDLNLDQIVDAITLPKKSYDLKKFFFTPLSGLDSISYRQEVMRDIEKEEVLAAIDAFAEKMARVKRYLKMSDELYYRYNKAGWFLEAVLLYGEAVSELAERLSGAPIDSRGMREFEKYLSQYIHSDGFSALIEEARAIKADLGTVRYCIRIKESNVRVSKCEPGEDYSVEVVKAFERFKQGDVKDYTVKIFQRTGMNHVEARIAECVAKFYPEIFSHLEQFYLERTDFLDSTIDTFDEEVQFYMAYVEFMREIRRSGLEFCYPEVSTKKEIEVSDAYDLALAKRLSAKEMKVVTNDFYLHGKERTIVVTGPNQGGKTTFARTFGQLHYLARLGCPVPGTSARLFLYDRMFTHFEKEEDITTMRGKLEDDLIRIREILDQATSNSIVIVNEAFSSTTLQDAIFLSKKIMEEIDQLDLFCVFVTFIDELASFSEKTVSMMSTVMPDDPSRRTYKIVRKPADGLAYAISIAEKHRLTFAQIKERMER